MCLPKLTSFIPYYCQCKCSHPLDRYAAKTDAELQELLIKMGSDKGGHMKLLDKVVFDDRVQGLSDSCVDLLRQLMHPNPKKRMTSDNFLRHPWVQGLTASCLAMDQAYGELKTQWQNRFRNKILNKFAVTVEKNENILDKSNLREIFNAIDLEGNGVLDPNELRVVLRSVGEPEDVISKIIASLDLKRDGGRVQGVSWEAFLNVMNIKHEQ